MLHHYYGPGVGPRAGVGGGLAAYGLLHLVFGLLVLLVIIWAVREYFKHQPKGHNPIEVAKLRYAKGEITKAEFEAIKKDLA